MPHEIRKVMPMAEQTLDVLDRIPLNRRHWTVLTVGALGSVLDALDLQMLSLAAPAIAKEWAISPQALGFVLSSTVAGMIVGAILFGVLGDYIGRRLGFQITVAIFAVFTGLCGFATDPEHLALLRFVAGVGIGGFVPVDTALVAEYMPARMRGRMMGLMALSLPLGGLFAAWIGRTIIPEYGWRMLFFVGLAPAAMIFLIRFLVPETPRYLLMRGRMDEAHRSLRWIVEGQPGGATVGPMQDSLLAPSPRALLAPAAPTFSILQPSVFRAEHRRRMLLACGLWMCWNFAYFGLLLWLPALLTQYKGVEGSAVFSYVMSFTAAGIAGRLAMAGILDRLGRRRSLVLASAGAGFCLVLLSASSDPSMLLLLLVATAFFLDSGHSAIFAYTPELFSTAVRSSGIGWAAAAGRVASTAAPIVVGAVVAEGVSFVFVMFAVSTVAAGVLILLTGTETKGTSLDALSPTAADQLHFSRQQLEAP